MANPKGLTALQRRQGGGTRGPCPHDGVAKTEAAQQCSDPLGQAVQAMLVFGVKKAVARCAIENDTKADAMLPRLGVPPRGERTYQRRPGAYALLVRGDHVLLTRKTDGTRERQLPGGGIDPGESQIAALHREVAEETGWTIGQPRRIGAYRRFAWLPDYGFWAEKICHIWLARPIIRHGAPTEPNHCADWVPLQAVPEVLSEPTGRDFLRLWLGHDRGPRNPGALLREKDRPRDGK